MNLSEIVKQHKISGWLLDETIDPATKLQQGDLIKFEASSDELRYAAIVVTADCDLEQKKHARLITLVPIVSAEVILERYLILEDCERKRKIIEDHVFKELSIDRSHDSDAKLTILQERTSEGASNLPASIKTASNFLLDRTDSIRISAYKELMQAIGSGPKKAGDLKNQIRNRGDLLVLPDAEALGVLGRIAWVRHIWQVPLAEIAIRTSELSGRSGERIARLASPYRYRLTQLMAQVFSDIGLPDMDDGIDQFLEDSYSNV